MEKNVRKNSRVGMYTIISKLLESCLAPVVHLIGKDTLVHCSSSLYNHLEYQQHLVSVVCPVALPPPIYTSASPHTKYNRGGMEPGSVEIVDNL